MQNNILHPILRRFRVRFLAFFSALNEQDVEMVLAGGSETLLSLLQSRYGYTAQQAITAWNEFVLRYVDGEQAPPRAPAQSPIQTGEPGQGKVKLSAYASRRAYSETLPTHSAPSIDHSSFTVHRSPLSMLGWDAAHQPTGLLPVAPPRQYLSLPQLALDRYAPKRRRAADPVMH